MRLNAQLKVSQIGSSLVIRIPRAIARRIRLKGGGPIALVLNDDDSVELRSAPHRYDIAGLIAGITPENRHPEIDWGKPS